MTTYANLPWQITHNAQVLPMLEDFTKVTLWLGGAVKTWETAKQFSKKLNDSRCHLIRWVVFSLCEMFFPLWHSGR